MTRPSFALVRRARLHAAGALALAAGTAAIIAVSAWNENELAGRLAIGGGVLFAAALVLGSPRLVGVATIPLLSAAVMASGASADPEWVQSIVVGCLWYVACESAWEAIERRDGAARTAAFNNYRTHEVATVVLLALATTSAGLAFSFLAPTRSIPTVGVVVLALVVALRRATGELRRAEA